MCLLTARDEWRRGFPVRRVYLNAAGEPDAEGVGTEFNALLCRPGSERAVAAALSAHLRGLSCEEFVVCGVSESALQAIEPGLAGWHRTAQWSTNYYVDLAALRQHGREYTDRLSSNTRAQIRRALKLYAAEGALDVHPAASACEAHAFFEELVALHQATWSSRGQSGAFGTPATLAFHRQIITRGVEQGTVQLLRVQAGGDTIGLLYEIIDGRRVYFYQSGFRYRADNRFKPGLVTHALAMEYWKARGLDEYHFLAGEDFDVRYKRSLATHAGLLGWITFQHPSFKMRAIGWLRDLKRRFRSLS
jgi:CelD/BcsL family acetyltransferase involved in cellulose biosynthesis